MKLILLLAWIHLMGRLHYRRSIRAAFLVFLFWYFTERYAFDHAPSSGYMVGVSLGLIILPLLNLFLRWRWAQWLQKTVYVLILGAVCIYNALLLAYVECFGKLGYEQMFAILQTNVSEASSYARSLAQSPTFLSAVALMMAAILMQAKIRSSHFARFIPQGRWRRVSFPLLVVPMAAFWQPNLKGFVPEFVLAKQDYLASIQQMKTLRAQRHVSATPPVSVAQESPAIHVLVIGESVNKFHMSAYGYFRATTPWLEQSRHNETTVIFENALANHTYTALAVPYMLSKLTAQNPGNVLQEETIVNKANALGYTSYWISNQQKEGLWDNAVGILSEDARTRFYLNHGKGSSTKTAHLDEALLPYVEAAIHAPGKKKFIVLHLMGSHAAYCDRVPQTLSLDTLTKGHFGPISEERMNNIDCYDKSILYTDSILKKIAALLKQSHLPATLTYTSDHGEEVMNGKGHDSSLGMSLGMVSIPAFFWTSPHYRKHYQHRVATLFEQRKRYFTNDYLYNLLLYLMEGEEAPIFHEDQENVILRHGDSTLHDIAEIKIREQTHRLPHLLGDRYLLAHRANSLIRLQHALLGGFDGVEVDVYYSDQHQEIMVGHDGDNKATSAGLPLSRYLALAQRNGYRQIWLDAKNLNPSTFPHFMRRLDQLDQQFPFKSRALIETSSPGEYVTTMTHNGWTLSYYIPTDALTDENPQRRQRYCQRLQKELNEQPFHAISFDSTFYEAMAEDCHSVLTQQRFNSWILGKSPSDADFISGLLKHRMLSDPHLSTLIVPFNSNTEL